MIALYPESRTTHLCTYSIIIPNVLCVSTGFGISNWIDIPYTCLGVVDQTDFLVPGMTLMKEHTLAVNYIGPL